VKSRKLENTEKGPRLQCPGPLYSGCVMFALALVR
jgi:hypothetical protein